MIFQHRAIPLLLPMEHWKGKAGGQLQEIMVNIIEAARERGAVGESSGWEVQVS